LTFYSNDGSISCRFWDIQCRKTSWPWNRGLPNLFFVPARLVTDRTYKEMDV